MQYSLNIHVLNLFFFNNPGWHVTCQSSSGLGGQPVLDSSIHCSIALAWPSRAATDWAAPVSSPPIHCGFDCPSHAFEGSVLTEVRLTSSDRPFLSKYNPLIIDFISLIHIWNSSRSIVSKRVLSLGAWHVMRTMCVSMPHAEKKGCQTLMSSCQVVSALSIHRGWRI